MRALVTGAGGFVAQHLMRALLANGHDVVAVARNQHQRLATDIVQSGHLELASVDLMSADQARSIVRDTAPACIYHLAARSSVADSFDDSLAVIHNNAATVIHILEAVRREAPSARTLIVSSSEVYGRPVGGELVDESCELRPESPYGVSKATQDLLGYQFFASYGLDVVRVRPFNHIGPGQSDGFVASSFAKQIAEIEAGKRSPEILVGNVSALRDFTDVRDIVRAYTLALAKGESGAVYNIGSGRATAVRSILEGLTALSYRPVEIRTDPTRLRPVDMPSIVCNPARFYALTGWKPAIPLEVTLSDLLDGWRARVRSA